MSIENEGDSAAGFDRAPDRYMGEREAIDLIRDRCWARAEAWLGQYGSPEHLGLLSVEAVADLLFAEHCASTAYKYRLRRGKKGDAERDDTKASWYEQMSAHTYAGDLVEDPRSGRVDRQTGRSTFVPYVRQPWPPSSPSRMVEVEPEYLGALRSYIDGLGSSLSADREVDRRVLDFPREQLEYRRRDPSEHWVAPWDVVKQGGGDVEDLAVLIVLQERARGVDVQLAVREAGAPFVYTLIVCYPDGSQRPVVDDAGVVAPFYSPGPSRSLS